MTNNNNHIDGNVFELDCSNVTAVGVGPRKVALLGVKDLVVISERGRLIVASKDYVKKIAHGLDKSEMQTI